MNEPGSKPRRGLLDRPDLTPEFISGVRSAWGVTESGEVADLGGSSTRNIRIAHRDGDLVARSYRTWVQPERLAAIQAARVHLAEHGIPSARPVPTVTGELWVEIDGHLVEAERYVSWDGMMEGWARIEDSLPLLGRLHSQLATLPDTSAGAEAPAANSIAKEDLSAGVTAGVNRLRKIATSQLENDLADLACALTARVVRAESALPEFPTQLVHGDYWHNNVYYRNDEIVLVADFDFLGPRPRIDDLALTLYYTNSTYADGRLRDQRRADLRRLIDAYDSGLDEPLSADERRAIPLAIVRTALGFIAQIADADSRSPIRQLSREMTPDLAWATAMLNDLAAWQDAFAST